MPPIVSKLHVCCLKLQNQIIEQNRIVSRKIVGKSPKAWPLSGAQVLAVPSSVTRAGGRSKNLVVWRAISNTSKKMVVCIIRPNLEGQMHPCPPGSDGPDVHSSTRHTSVVNNWVSFSSPIQLLVATQEVVQFFLQMDGLLLQTLVIQTCFLLVFQVLQLNICQHILST